MRFLRKQLNTDPNEREEMNLGTQTIKIALANLRMNDDYIDPFTGKTIKGKDLYKKIMRSYNILTDLGFEQVMRRFSKKDFKGGVAWQNILNDDAHFSLPEIDEEALSTFLYEELQQRDANDNMFEAIRHDGETDRLAAPLSAISQSGWIDSILASYINKTIIDTKSPGSAYIQRSIFCMEGEGDKTLYGGKELKLVNDDGSMDAVISIDFFEKVIPGYENMTFEQARQWLIDHKLVGDEAKTYTISYRIPTQAQSSINPLKFVDVVPVIRDSIILPKEFTKLTGSDFDIDKLFLSRLFINPDTIENPDQMFTYLDDPNASEDKKIELLRKGYTNNLFKQYITLLMDKQSAKTKWRPIDADTELWEDVYKDLYPNSQQPIESMSQDTIAYQTEQKNNFVVGKIGIGPFALNNNNHIYTMLYGISLGSSESLLRSLGKDNLDMGTLCGDRDIYGNSILSWLSGGINAHVDIAKDPFVTKLNVNKYTYNITNFLLRAGFGRNGLWFLNLPVIKELARQMNGISGQYLKQSSKSEFEAQEELLEKYKQKLVDAIPQNIKDAQIPGENDTLSEVEGVIGRTLTIGDIIYNRDAVIKSIAYSKLSREVKGELISKFKGYCEQTVEKAFLNDMVETDKDKSILYRTVKGGNTKSVVKSGDKVLMIDENVYNYIAILVFESINKNEAKTTSDLTKFAKIDTKKQGSTVAAQIDFLSRYEQFVFQQFDESAKVHGDVSGFFGLLSDTDILGFDTSLMLNRPESDQLAISGEVFEGGVDITEAGYAPRYNNSPVASFIDNKTKKAINALIAIIRNDSIEGTYGFNLIWNRVKSDFGKTSLTEDAQKKLRAAILGATKHAWAMSTMKKLGINPVGLFRDENDSMSLAHELVKLKTKRVSYEGADGRKTFGTVAQKYKDNALLNMLFDGHTKDEHTQTDKLIEILDFIKIHVPFTDDSKKSNVYIRAWRDLHNDPVTKDFAVKLMFYSLLTSNDSGGNNIFKYVPFEMLQQYGLFDAERELIRQLGDPSVQFAKNNSEYLKIADVLIKDIVDRVESILVEDFEFSTPFAIETRKYTQDRLSGQTVPYSRKEYTGFGSKFGNEITANGNTEETDRVPYVFIPVRISSNGYVSPSETMSKSTKNGTVFTNNQYIRVLNPVANYENSQKYLTYKKIGEIVLPVKDKSVPVPIYQLVDSCMYKLGQYKVYNYNNEMEISSSQIVATMKKYTLTSPYSLEQLNQFIKDAVSKIKTEQEEGGSKTLQEVLAPLYEIDEQIKMMHKEKLYKDKEDRVRTVYLPLYDDSKYLEFYLGQNNAGRKQTLSDLQFALNAKGVDNQYLFSQEDRILIQDMINAINVFNEHLEQAQKNKKAPKNANNPATFHMNSGGAHGSDLEWAAIAKEFGMLDDPNHISHYYYGEKTEGGNFPISEDDYKEGIRHVETANDVLKRKPGSYMHLLARNWKQVKESDGVFAIGNIKAGNVDGGTGWAIQMAKDAGKQVHVFDLQTERWYTWDSEKKTFVYESTPKLTKNFAGIGTRSIEPNIETLTNGKVKYVGDQKREAALNAMRDVFKNTFGEPKKQDSTVKQEEVKSEKTPLQAAIEKAEGFIGETNGSVYQKQGDKFVLKSGTQLLDTLKTITDRGHNPEKWSFGDDYDGQISYNIGYESGTNAVMSVTNRDLYDDGWKPSTILAMREDNRIGNPLDQYFKQYIDQFGKDVTFLVSEKDTPLLEYLNSREYKYEIYDKSSTEDIEVNKSEKKEPVFTKVNDAFAEVLIKHLLNDPMPGYETKEKREFLANLARGVFQWIKREKFKVLITNAPYSDVEAGKTSTVSIFASFATIYYQDVDLQGGKYLNILHELLHIITKQAIPFDSMGRAIADEKMQLYYDMFRRKIGSDPEWKDIQDVVYNPTQETFDKASNRAKILAHAYSDAGEFISCCISNVEVQQVLESITYDETQKSTVFDEIKRWFGELLDKIFRGNEKLSHSNFVEDVTNFLFDVKYDMGYVHQMLDSGDFEAEAEYLKYINSLKERYDNAIDFGGKNEQKTINVYSKGENANLSNFAPRPFRTQVSKTYPAVDVNHVEHAFQLAKAVFANQHGDITDHELFTIQKGMQNARPEECRKIGRSLKMSPATLAEWNKVSSKMLEAQMRRSFNAHPEVTAELLRTGDAKITHNYPNGNPIDERFGPILEKIRSDIRKEQELDKNCN